MIDNFYYDQLIALLDKKTPEFNLSGVVINETTFKKLNLELFNKYLDNLPMIMKRFYGPLDLIVKSDEEIKENEVYLILDDEEELLIYNLKELNQNKTTIKIRIAYELDLEELEENTKKLAIKLNSFFEELGVKNGFIQVFQGQGKKEKSLEKIIALKDEEQTSFIKSKKKIKNESLLFFEDDLND